MPSEIIQGDVREVLPTLEPGSIDCAITSPPYWRLRSYLPKAHPLKPLEIGSEPTPAAFVQTMVEVFRLVRAALADHAVCFVNIGDSYNNSQSGFAGTESAFGKGSRHDGAKHLGRRGKPSRELPTGNLCLIPQRLAIALQDDGWLVRSVIVWHKPAPMPASLAGWRWARCRVKVKEGGRGGNGHQRMLANETPCNVAGQPVAQWADCPGCPKCAPNGGYALRRGSWRPTSAWEPILMLAKKPGYYADGEAVKVPATSFGRQHATTVKPPKVREMMELSCGTGPTGDLSTNYERAEANLRDVWVMAAEPLSEKHYAAFPTELVYRCLAAATSQKGYCPACGAPWARVIEKAAVGNNHGKRDDPHASGHLAQCPQDWENPATTLGWRPTCPCPGDLTPRPARVLDPFAGSGRVGVQCQRMGLDFVGIELNPEYADMSQRILHDANPLFSE